MPQRPVKVAVVGVGVHGQHHARIYSALPDVELAAVVDIKKARSEDVAKQYKTSPEYDYRALLGKVDAVSVAVPTESHHAIGLDFLRSGTDVLVEKPVSRTLQEVDELIDTAKRNDRILMVGHVERFNPAATALLELALEPRFIEVHRLGAFPERSTDIDVILDVMIHDLDIILKLVRSPVQNIDAVGVPVLTSKLDIANARIRFQNGCTANVTASRVSTDKVRKMRIFQLHNYISLDYSKQELLLYYVDKEGGSTQAIGRKNVAIKKQEPLKIELEAFLKSVRKRTLPPATGEDGKNALGLALKIVEAIHHHCGSTDGRA